MSKYYSINFYWPYIAVYPSIIFFFFFFITLPFHSIVRIVFYLCTYIHNEDPWTKLNTKTALREIKFRQTTTWTRWNEFRLSCYIARWEMEVFQRYDTPREYFHSFKVLFLSRKMNALGDIFAVEGEFYVKT